MTDISSTKKFKLGRGLRVFISSLYIALFILSAGDLLRSFENIGSVWGDTEFLNQTGAGSLIMASLFVGTLTAILLPIGSAYLAIAGFRGKQNNRWISISALFTTVLLLLAGLVNILFVAQGFYSDNFVLGWRSFVNLYFSNSGYGDAMVGSREALITVVAILISVFSLIVLLTNKKTFLNPLAKKIATLFAPVSKRIADLWAPVSNQLSSKATTKPSEAGSFAKTLLDVSFNKFIYIKVSSLLYFIFLLLIALSNSLLVVVMVVGVTLGSVAPENILLIPVSFIASILVVILMRLAFESGIALIKIAENTSKQ